MNGLRVVPAALSVALAAGPAAAQAVVGQKAPAFSVQDSHGKTRSLGEFQGKLVVLEWWNPECPFVAKHYSGSMQRLQKEWTARGVTWLTVNSSAPGNQGHVEARQAEDLMKQKGAGPTAILLDATGTLGMAYGAKTTPHMFVVAKDGSVAYAGGIDDKASTDTADLAAATNYVAQALTELTAGKAVSVPSSQPYGCSVKYAR